MTYLSESLERSYFPNMNNSLHTVRFCNDALKLLGAQRKHLSRCKGSHHKPRADLVSDHAFAASLPRAERDNTHCRHTTASYRHRKC